MVLILWIFWGLITLQIIVNTIRDNRLRRQRQRLNNMRRAIKYQDAAVPTDVVKSPNTNKEQ